MQNLRKPNIFDGYNYVKNSVTGYWNRNGGKICTIAGTAGLIFTGVHSCRKTYKIHDELKANGDRIRNARKKSRWAAMKETVISSAKTSRHYAVDAVAGALSAYAVAKGWHTEHQHYQQAAAMVGVVMADFLNYRQNVISEQGEEADRRYLTSKRAQQVPVAKDVKSTQVTEAEDAHILELNPDSLKILYSKETTPKVWTESLVLRKLQLEDIQNRLNMDLIYGGSYTVNDVRRYFYGRQGDIGEGGMYGRIWDPGDPEHPERGAMVNLHYEEDEDFMTGRTDYTWIIIDIDYEPLFELMKRKKDRETANSI